MTGCVAGLVAAVCGLGASGLSAADARLRVAVLPFSDADEEPVLGRTAAHLVLWTLELNPSLEVLALDRTLRLADEASCSYLRKPPTDGQLAALAKRAGVQAILYGRFTYKQKRWVTGWLFDATRGRTVAAASKDAEDGYFMRIALTGAVPMRLLAHLRPRVRVVDRLPDGRVELSAGRSSGLLRYTRLRWSARGETVTVEVEHTRRDRSCARVVSGSVAVARGAVFQVIAPESGKEDTP